MKYIKNFTVILFTLILFSVCVSADYTTIGYNNDYFNETGFFNSALTDVDSTTRSISSPQQIPLTADLDGDGNNEIVVLDGSTFYLYQDSSLTVLDNLIISTGTKSNFIISDIDGDNYKEIIVADLPTNLLWILEYNGTHFYNQTTISLGGLTYVDGQVMLQCKDTDDCILIYDEEINRHATNVDTVYAITFNSTALYSGGQTVIDVASQHDDTFCFPYIRNIDYGDIDKDGTTEYAFTYHETVITGSGSKLWLTILDTTTNGSISTIDNNNIANPVYFDDEGTGPTPDCTNDGFGKIIKYAGTETIPQAFTSPLIMDINGGGNLEIIVGFKRGGQNVNDFSMLSMNFDGSVNDDYPETTYANGKYISNVFEANVFEDTARTDFCMLGYNNDDTYTNIVCGSELSGRTTETVEWFFDSLTNVTSPTSIYSTFAGSTKQSSTNLKDGNNLDEIITPYGVVQLDDGDVVWGFGLDCALFGICNANVIWANPEDTLLYPNDFESVGRSDILGLSPTNLWYFDDGYSNSPAELDAVYSNPCIDYTWKINTSVEIRPTIIDVDGDSVSARAILYYNNLSGNIQDSGWSINSSSGTTFPFNFEANQTIGSGILKIYYRDTGDETIGTTDFSFSVGTNGIEFGDSCTTDVITSEENETITPTPTINETQTSGIGDLIVSTSGLDNSWRYVIGIGILLLFTFGSFEFLRKQHGVQDANILLLFTGGIAFITWLGLVMIDMLPVWTVIVGLVFGAVALAFKVFNMLENKNSGGV